MSQDAPTESPAVEVWPGSAYPLGATYDGAGTNFALFSEVAEAVAIMERSGALAACHERANGYLQGVRDTLAKYPQGEPRQLFEALLEYMVTRGY
nr:hypothetical protein [uncultured Rhodococcus sp.]